MMGFFLCLLGYQTGGWGFSLNAVNILILLLKIKKMLKENQRTLFFFFLSVPLLKKTTSIIKPDVTFK